MRVYSKFLEVSGYKYVYVYNLPKFLEDSKVTIERNLISWSFMNNCITLKLSEKICYKLSHIVKWFKHKGKKGQNSGHILYSQDYTKWKLYQMNVSVVKGTNV